MLRSSGVSGGDGIVIFKKTIGCDECTWTKTVEAVPRKRAVTMSLDRIQQVIKDADTKAKRALYYHKKAAHHGTSDTV